MNRLETIDELRGVLSKLRERGFPVKKDLVKIGNVIDKESFAPLADLKIWGDNIIAWLTSSAESHDLYSKLFNRALPEKIAAAEAALNAEEKKIHESIIVGQAENFLLFFTEDAGLASNLREHQARLKKILSSKKRDDKLKTAVEPYAKFFNATQEKDSVKRYEMSDGLRDFFSADLIWRGIFNGELILATVDAAKPVAAPKSKTPSLPPPPPVNDGFVKLLQERGAILSEADFDKWRDVFTIEKTERTKPFNTTQFKRDFKTVRSPEMIKSILSYISFYGLLKTPFFCPKNISPDLLQNALQLLIVKGYIQEYAFENLNSFFGLTGDFYDFMQTNEGKKFIAPKNFDKLALEKFAFIDGDVTRCLTRCVYFVLHGIELKQHNSFRQMHFEPQAFLASFDDCGEYDVLIGCFWDSTDGCDKFLKNLIDLLNREKEIRRMIFAGLTTQHAGDLFNAFDDFLAENFPLDALCYLYALDSNGFFDAYNLKELSPDEIWGYNNHDEDDSNNEECGIRDEELQGEPAQIEDIDEDPDDEPETPPVVPPDVYEPDTYYEHEELAEDDDGALNEVKGLLLNRKFYCATAYLKAQSLTDAQVEPLYRLMAFALDDPLSKESYSAAAILTVVPQDDSPFHETLAVAAALRAFFYNDVEFDYNVPALYKAIEHFETLNDNEALARLVKLAKDFKVENQKGADYFVESFNAAGKVAAQFAQVIGEAEIYYRQFFESDFRGETGHTIAKTKQRLFDNGDEFCAVFKLVKAPLGAYTADALNKIKNFLTERFIRKGAALDDTNFDQNKLADWVESCWDEVKAKHNKNSIVGDRRSNLISNLERAGVIMCEWVRCAENYSGSRETRHSEIFAEMATASEAAYKKLGKKIVGKTLEAAGNIVLARAIQEISARLDGSFDRAARQYFYVQFLCGECVILDEHYLPKLDLNISDGTREYIAEQILKHAASKLPSFEERIERIFKKSGDDFGVAKLLDDYIKATTGESFIEKKGYQLDKCVISAAKDAVPKLEEFKGGVELAQIHGQLNSDADKERILQIVDNCYEYARASNNYGVFFRVKKYWEDTIRQDAAKFAQTLEEDLQSAIDDFKNAGNVDSGALATSVDEIKKLLKGGNFAAARTLIEELSRGQLYKESAAEDVTLSRFIDGYSDCYGKVQNISTSLKNLLSKQSSDKNKFDKARGELIDSWLPNGMPDSAGGKEKYRERVQALLERLGFDVESVTFSDEADSKSLNFEVKLKKSFQMTHTHPIAAFGSEAEVGKAGFRVTCLFGQFPQENLIDYFKKLDAGNTLVLLDHALKLPERRRLARAIKSDCSLMHIFAVVDRVDIMYLIKNCSEQIGTKRINDTLMSLIMPFSKCQPYISNSPELPPEMFIGRENAMHDVKNPDGVNIVYGGRQLGKSALLKMACREIDGNKNQRAIYVEIRNKDYRAAALYTSRELSDANFFTEPIETDDWEVLTRAIKIRLSTETPNKISYFLLMLDEADRFIESCAAVRYAPIDALSRIQQINYNGGRFKFVIAGLRNIVRFERDRAQSDNPILPVLKPLTITPFKFEEARKLLEVPLRCLGLRFADDKLIFTIAETALYFPGIIQLFCEKLLLTLFEPNNSGYGENAPPYEISESHIKKILADEEFIRDIKKKIEITLRLGDDKYYYVIAQVLAYLYHENFNVDGYTPADILNCAEGFELIKARYLPREESKVDALMTELCELNILRKSDSGKYLFARQRIFNYMGTRAKVEAELVNLMEEAADE